MVKSDQAQSAFTVAVDAMGGDHAPMEPVAGAVQAARQEGIQVLLVGDQVVVEAELARHQINGLPISLAPSEGVIQETDHPMQAMREKPRASVVEAAKLVKAGKVQAMVTMGSTGAAMASATVVLGLLEGVERPTLGGPLLGNHSPMMMLDLGSNMDCRPSQLLGFGAIGVAFVRTVQGIRNPRVALLCVGTEEGKGNRQVREAYGLFQASGLNFIGNVEGVDLFLDKADVVVCDGFVGNVLLKFAEGLGMVLAQRLPRLLEGHLSPETMQSVLDDVAGLTNAVVIRGGGPLFGIDGVVIVGHGRSRASGISEAINMARYVVGLQMVEAMRRELAALQQPVKG